MCTSLERTGRGRARASAQLAPALLPRRVAREPLKVAQGTGPRPATIFIYYFHIMPCDKILLILILRGCRVCSIVSTPVHLRALLHRAPRLARRRPCLLPGSRSTQTGASAGRRGAAPQGTLDEEGQQGTARPIVLSPKKGTTNCEKTFSLGEEQRKQQSRARLARCHGGPWAGRQGGRGGGAYIYL